MNISPDTDFDLEKLFLPAWATESPSVNKYAGFKGEERRDRKDDDRMGRRPPRRDGPRPGGPGGSGGRPGGRPGGGRSEGGPRGGGGQRQQDFRGRNEDRGPRPAPPAPPPEVDITIIPDEKGVELLARLIRMTGRAYPLFDIAQLILDKPERQQVRFQVVKKADGQPAQQLFHCALDDTLWLSVDEAVGHLLGRHFGTFYQAERTATEPPKGTYTFVAQCGLSGNILGPPNYHGYQDQLRKLHTERFARMPFDEYKSRVKIVRDEPIVKKWLEDQSFKTEYNCLNVAEPLKVATREDVEKHFREVHLPTLIKTVESHQMSGPASRQLRSPALQRLIRSNWEDQRRFPLGVATTLSQQFAHHGLQFFKVNRTVTHVSVARPNYLDLEATPVSEGVRKIIEFINTTPKGTRKKMFEKLAPSAPVAAAPAPANGATEAAPAPAPEATPEQAALAADLHWLVHQGHVIEFASGLLETAKKPLPRPAKPEPKAPVEAAPSAAPTPAPAEAAPAAVADAPVTSTEPVAAEPVAVAPAV